MSRTPWTLYDPKTNTTLHFAVNPESGGDVAIQRAFSVQTSNPSDGTPLVIEVQDDPQSLDLKSSILSVGDRDALTLWAQKGNKLLVTNDLGEQLWIYIDAFTPTRHHKISHAYFADYTIHFVVLGTP